ncbi:MAG: ABC transporter permease subunit [Ruminococcaceae bacterium]|nr:ABC transporter permease subunit [Oscillospiraceae bacterium]
MANKEKKNTVFSTLARWGKRMFFGASKELSDEERFAVENIESPSVMAVKAFFRRKIAVAALILLVSLFLFVFIGPEIWPMDVNYTDPLQANIAPNYTFLKVPSELAGNIRDISGFGGFTVGVSNDNTLYIWGNKVDNLSKVDYSKFPAEIQPGKVAYAAAGSDHIIAITTDGKVVGWGNNGNGQYGMLASPDDPYIQMPDELMHGTIDPNQVQQLICGYQCTVLVMKDGTTYAWGNKNAMLSLPEVTVKFSDGVQKVALTNYYALMLMEDGTVTGGSTLSFQMVSATNSATGTVRNLKAYLEGKTAVDIAATNNCYAAVLSDGSIVAWGAAQYGEKDVPAAPEGEKYVSVKAGTRHFVALTDKDTVVSWGHNDHGQTNLTGKTADDIFVGAKQTYLVDENDDLTDKAGFKGYLMGTDKSGRDVFTRIVHGGKMTMTIGAVAVIVSTIIAIIVGCISGYFGGWVDMLLMRVTEIFSAIPFLPFAMMLSFVIRTMPIGETTRIFIIMVMLGILSWTGLARMIRAQVLAEREKEFVIAAKSMGIKETRIAFKHILPNVISIILVNVTLDFAGCLLTESSLSYLGFGVQQPQPTWGNMLDGANNSIVIQNYWWQWVFPAIFLSLATISINIIGDTLRDVLDPKSSQEK